jgi:hypothetical protein
MTHRVSMMFYFMSFFMLTACRQKALTQTAAAVANDRDKRMIVIKLSENALNSDRNAASPIAAKFKELDGLIQKWGLTLEPMHPNAADATLMSYFNCAIPDGEAGEKILDALRKTAGIEAAYVASTPSLPKN